MLILSLLLLHKLPSAVASRPIQSQSVLPCKLSRWADTKILVVQFNHLAPLNTEEQAKDTWQSNDLYHISRLYQPYFFKQQVSTTYTVVQKGFVEAAAPGRGMAPHFYKISILKHMLNSYPQFDYVVWLVRCYWHLQESGTWPVGCRFCNSNCSRTVQPSSMGSSAVGSVSHCSIVDATICCCD